MSPPTRGVDTPTAQRLAAVRQRSAGAGCAGGQHYMRRDPDGPPDRPWRCIDCDTVRPWSGGFGAWLIGHAPLVAAASAEAAP